MLKLKLINSPKPLKIKFSYNFPEVLPVVLEEKTIIPKIVDQIIIPSSNYDGMSQVTVKAVDSTIDENIKSENIKKDVSILGVQGNVEGLKGTKIEITKNGTYTPEEPYNAFTEVDVATTNDPTEWFGNEYMSGNTAASGVEYSIIKLPLLPIHGNSAERLFYNQRNIKEIPLIDLSNCISAVSMCSSCVELQHFPLLNFANITNMDSLCNYCLSLLDVAQIDTSNVIVMSYAFRNCKKLKSIPLLNAVNVNNINSIVQGCSALTNLGGLQNLGQAYLTTASANYSNYKLILSDSSKLTHDSLMNVINNLYDIATKGVKTQQLVLGSTNIAKLTAEEVAIGTSKGWSIS